MSKRALVTGGLGFIGSHLVDALVARGWTVRVLDNLDRRVHPQGRPAYASPDAEYVLADVRDKASWERALRGVDVVFHQAAYQDYMPDFSTFISTNATSTALAYEVIRERQLPVEKVVVASSQATYGEGQYRCAEHGLIQPPTRSEAQLLRGEWELACPVCARPMAPERLLEEFAHPFNPYAISKYFEELIAIRFGRLLGIPSVALRYSITQGPRQSMFNQYSGICRIFTLRYLRGDAPVIFEDGQQTRDFVHVRDVVAANLLVATDDRANYQAFNVGSGRAKCTCSMSRSTSLSAWLTMRLPSS